MEGVRWTGKDKFQGGLYDTVKFLHNTKSNANAQVNRATNSLQAFLHIEALGGLLLMGASVLALIIANSPLSEAYTALLSLPLVIKLGDLGIAKPLLLWINDGLMAVFFLLVGLELKRELLEGHLSDWRRASLPAFAAVGGILAPVAFYMALNWRDPAALKGWAIPMATDIAFALGVLSLLGKRVPAALKAFLLSVAIFDDIGAVVVITLFYTADLSLTALAVAALFVVGLAWLNRAGVTRLFPYLLLGVPLWVAVLKSGVHATLAGVILALFIPLRAPTAAAADVQSTPLHRLEHALHPWVAFGILPIFAFANAGVSLSGLSLDDLLHPVPLGIVAGLFLGKQIGIMLMSGLAVKSNLASLPAGVQWTHLYGVATLCGIGFTMSLFIASLAFQQEDSTFFGLERLGILMGSLLAGLAGYAILRIALREQKVGA